MIGGKEGASELVVLCFLRMLLLVFVLKNVAVDLYSVTLFDHGPYGSYHTLGVSLSDIAVFLQSLPMNGYF